MRVRSGWTLGTDLPKKGIVIICSLDAQSENVGFIRDLIRRRGHEPILLDFSMELAPPFPGDVTCEQVAARGGLPIEKVRASYRSDRVRAIDNQIAGGAMIVRDLLRQGRVHGVIGFGCRTASIVGTGIMKTLPFGLPKLMASPAAADPAANESYVGTRDITLHHTVLDIGKPNPLLKAQITNAVGAICGMVEMTRGTEYVFDKPVVAVSSSRCGGTAVGAALAMLEEEGFTPVVCDAFGKGARAMEEMIRDGAFSGVIDLCTGGVLDDLFARKRDVWTGRLMGAVTRGIPAVLAPCGLDTLGDSGRIERRTQTLTRTARTVHCDGDSQRVQVQATAEQLIAAADAIAGRLNQAKAPFTFLIPLKGWSSLNAEGRPMFDPVAEAAFAQRLKEKIAARAAVVELDLNLDSPAFARAAVDEFVRLFAAGVGQRMLSASR
jgi:uncharacterized protein (UPF0261 family)